MRFVTDGTLLEEVKKLPFLTRAINKRGLFDKDQKKISWVKEYTADLRYDVVIVDEAHEHNTNMDLILTLVRESCYTNNRLKLVIISATMEDDEPIYRRFYRKINDNRAYPLSSMIAFNGLDRANMDRRIDISKPRATTQFKVKDHFLFEMVDEGILSKQDADNINEGNFVDWGIKVTVSVLKRTDKGHLLLFMTGRADIDKSVEEINKQTPSNIICFAYRGELTESERDFVTKINENLPTFTGPKKINGQSVPSGTYDRAVIIATNAAEASITVSGLMYVVDTGYAKVNIYDPITQISSLVTMMISFTSSRQRRGRVGRTAPGDVYYLYNEEKVRDNRTAYKIADENIRDTLVDLLKLEPSDYPIITMENDVNNLKLLNKISKLSESKSNSNEQFVLERVFKNLGIYFQIIIKQYMLLEESESLDDYEKFYTYYGVGSCSDKRITDYQSSEYLTLNHDDYHYQKDELVHSRCHTGFDTDILEDPTSKLSFYIIHPDENIICRNPFTGMMISIKKSKSVSSAYYHLVCSQLGLFKKKNLNKCFQIKNFDFDNFDLPKYDMFMNDAKSLSLVIETDSDIFDSPSIRLETVQYGIIRDILIAYYDYINSSVYHPNQRIILKSGPTDKINQAKKITGGKIDVLSDYNHLLWYLYSVPFGLGMDVLAMCCLFGADTRFKTWVEDPDVSSAKKFLNMGHNPQGDIYFFWTIWLSIKKELLSNNLLDGLNIDERTKIEFILLKDLYTNHQLIPNINNYLILDSMSKSGTLNTLDEYYSYIKLKVTLETNIQLTYKIPITSIANNISKKFMLKSDIIEKFILTYLTTISEVNRAEWIYEYEVKRKLNDDAEPDEINVIDWVKTKLKLDRIWAPSLYIDDRWNTILETYLRSHANNLVRNEVSYWMNVHTGYPFALTPWSKKIDLENTVLNNKTKYIIYHNTRSTSSDEYIYYLTPVKLEWIIKLNPIYYYYSIRNSAEFIDMFGEDYILLNQIKEIVADIKNTFNLDQLLSYVSQIDDKILSKSIMATTQKKLNFKTSL